MTQHEGLDGFTDPQVPIRLQGPQKVLRRSGNILLKMFSSKVFPEKHRGSIPAAKAAAWYHFTVTTLENKPPADLMLACSFFSREMTKYISNNKVAHKQGREQQHPLWHAVACLPAIHLSDPACCWNPA